ncbi:hypothetical protein WNY78_07960 [Psychroserpens sp. AS72]|uniref:hypothetical protein n=1 Tax=Psychroserpens sp. AS72 TaxID=3135775 RepID=UPI00317D16A5
MNHFNICPTCMHSNSCVLTTQKDKVWSCSEFDEIGPPQVNLKDMQQPERALELV